MDPPENKSRALRADALLLVTAILWGLAFVAQREGMEHVGPFLYGGIRFALGALALVPLIIWTRARAQIDNNKSPDSAATMGGRAENRGGAAIPRGGAPFLWGGAIVAGLILFVAASLQQAGLVTTGATNAGFITGLYVVLVPVLGIFLGKRTGLGTWLGVALVFAGLYLLSVKGDFSMSSGDMLVMLGAVFWALHVLTIGYLSPRTDAFKLAAFQYGVCAALSLGVALAFEEVSLSSVSDAWLPILYGGLVSVGIAYTLQVVAQRDAHPAHASIILSLESAFAALGGWLVLGETLGARGMVGCALMLIGMLASQAWTLTRKSDSHAKN
jgi:drug/metabolite transporter (DMT)-like permease